MSDVYRNPEPCARHAIASCVACDEQVPVAPTEGVRCWCSHGCFRCGGTLVRPIQVQEKT